MIPHLQMILSSEKQELRLRTASVQGSCDWDAGGLVAQGCYNMSCFERDVTWHIATLIPSVIT